MGKDGHCIMDPAANNTFLCTVCNESYTFGIPCTVGMFSAMTRHFIREHRSCASKESEIRERPETSDTQGG